VLYHRGEEFPLGTKIDRAQLRRAEAQLQRTFAGFETRRMLSAGFRGAGRPAPRVLPRALRRGVGTGHRRRRPSGRRGSGAALRRVGRCRAADPKRLPGRELPLPQRRLRQRADPGRPVPRRRDVPADGLVPGAAAPVGGGARVSRRQARRAIASKIGDRQVEYIALGNLGNAYSQLSEADATKYFEQARKIAGEVGDRQVECSVLDNLGTNYAGLGEVGKAIEHHVQCLSIARQIGDRRSEGSALNNLANCHASLGQVGIAIRHCDQALAIGQAIADLRIVNVASKLLAMLRRDGEGG
jgi:hypothetical protein